MIIMQNIKIGMCYLQDSWKSVRASSGINKVSLSVITIVYGRDTQKYSPCIAENTGLWCMSACEFSTDICIIGESGWLEIHWQQLQSMHTDKSFSKVCCTYHRSKNSQRYIKNGNPLVSVLTSMSLKELTKDVHAKSMTFAALS